MINKDFAEYPEHRVSFFKLLRAINLSCFEGANPVHLENSLISLTHILSFLLSALLTLPPPQFKTFMDSIIWAIKHTMRDITDIGLNRALLSWSSFHSINFLHCSHSRSYQQFCGRGPSDRECFLPAVLYQRSAGYLLRPDGY
jgi:hypothetical protein